MLHTSTTSTGPDLTQLKQLARETHDQVRRVRARAHRLCGLLDNQRSEEAPSRQDDGWFYYV
jgi:hypothetical protein